MTGSYSSGPSRLRDSLKSYRSFLNLPSDSINWTETGKQWNWNGQTTDRTEEREGYKTDDRQLSDNKKYCYTAFFFNINLYSPISAIRAISQVFRFMLKSVFFLTLKIYERMNSRWCLYNVRMQHLGAKVWNTLSLLHFTAITNQRISGPTISQ